MILKKSHILHLSIIFILFILLTACADNTNNSTPSPSNNTKSDIAIGQKELTIPYVSWATTVAGVNVIKAVLQDIGYDITLSQVQPGIIFASIADGKADLSVGAVTLPTTHKDYWNEYKDNIDDVHITLDKGITIGLAVPTYMDIDSIQDLKDNTNNIGEKIDWTITGIDPGAGQMQITKDKVMPGYGLDNWTLQSSSAPAMTSALKKAIDAKDPIVVTLWEPHWTFLRWDLKYLKDPNHLFGDPDSLHAIARKGLKEDAPAAYQVLKHFQWTKKDMGEVMVMIKNGDDPYTEAKKWVNNHQDIVKEWTKGIAD